MQHGVPALLFQQLATLRENIVTVEERISKWQEEHAISHLAKQSPHDFMPNHPPALRVRVWVDKKTELKP